jgi:hypothetical protein
LDVSGQISTRGGSGIIAYAPNNTSFGSMYRSADKLILDTNGNSAPIEIQGNKLISTGDVGIGTDPSVRLHVNGGNIALVNTSFPSLTIGTGVTSGVYGGVYWDTTNNFFILNTNPSNNYPILIQGTECRTNRLVPASDNTYALGTGSSRWTQLSAVTATINTSDIREKKDISDTTLGLEFIKELRPVDYKWIVAQNKPIIDASGQTIGIEPIPGKRVHHGFISQEVKQLLDKYNVDSGLWILTDTTNPESSQGLRYTELIAPMVKAIQELHAENTTLSSEITILKSENTTLSSEISALKSELTSIKEFINMPSADNTSS